MVRLHDVPTRWARVKYNSTLDLRRLLTLRLLAALFRNFADKASSGIVLEKIVEYFQYWYKYKDRDDVPDMDIPAELCLELLQAGDFLQLDCKARPCQRSRVCSTYNVLGA
jgi:hypothetical protein